jgi:hypothetical protein
MQEEQTVAFQPIYEGYHTWYSNLFFLYLFVTLIVIIVRVVTVGWNLRKLKKTQRVEGTDLSDMNLSWSRCYAKTHSFRGLAIFTFLLSLLNFTWLSSDILGTVRTAKTPGLAYILQAEADALRTLSVGILLCVVLYLCAVFGEHILHAIGSRSNHAFETHVT